MIEKKLLATFACFLLAAAVGMNPIFDHPTSAKEGMKSLKGKKSMSILPSYLTPLTKAKLVSDDTEGERPAEAKEIKEYKLFVRATKDTQLTAESLEFAVKRATPAGKIYLAMILVKRFPTRGKSVLRKLGSDPDKFDFQTGCEIMGYTVGNAANELLTSGKLLTLDLNAIK